VSGTSINYQWSAVPGATSYWITISTSSNPNDTSKYKYSNGLGNVIQYTDTGYPNNGTTCYWWVAACTSAGWTPQSQILANGFSFINGVASSPPSPTPTPPTNPSAPTLLSPGNVTVVSGTSINYQWSAVPGATSYWITISTSSNPNDTSKYKYSNGVGNVIQYNNTGYPNNGTTYYWWVAACTSAGWTPQSQILANGFSFINGT
jgi:hypothetical protein